MATAAAPRVGGIIESSSDSEEDVPLSARMTATAPSSAGATNQNGSAVAHSNPAIPTAKRTDPDSDSSDDERPLARRIPLKQPQPAAKASRPFGLDDAQELVAAPRPRPKPTHKPSSPKPARAYDSSDSEDDKPLALRRPSIASGTQHLDVCVPDVTAPTQLCAPEQPSAFAATRCNSVRNPIFCP
jgi:hypothetical protein